jgi:DNA (cytosine-5)-methyltransferase 1
LNGLFTCAYARRTLPVTGQPQDIKDARGVNVADTLIAMDLFAGCGGLSLGLRKAGINVAWANEYDPHAAETYRRSHPGTLLYEEDATSLYQRLLRKEPNLPERGDVDFLVGGPPCQGFSGFNRHRHVDDPRNSLMDVFLTFVDWLRPRFVLLENVVGLLSLDGGRIAGILLTALHELGYATRLGIVQAGYYGLPQNRWRVFIWASIRRRQLPNFPQPTHDFPRTTILGATKFRNEVVKPPSNGQSLFWNPLPPVTVGDSISDLPPIENGGGEEVMEYCSAAGTPYQEMLRHSCNNLFDHQTAKLTRVMLDRCQAVPKKPGAGWVDLPDHLKPKNLLRHGDERYKNRFGRLHWEGIFNTILSRPHPYWGAVFHPEQDRVISVRESARAQGFPDNVHFSGPISKKYVQIGNAVPPLLASKLGESLMSSLS